MALGYVLEQGSLSSAKCSFNQEREENVKLLTVVLKCPIIIWASTYEKLPSGFANNKGADQTHPPSLVSAFVICLLEIIISRLAPSEISIF